MPFATGTDLKKNLKGRKKRILLDEVVANYPVGDGAEAWHFLEVARHGLPALTSEISLSGNADRPLLFLL